LREQLDPRARDLLHGVAATGIAIALAVAGWGTVSPDAQQQATATRYPVDLLDDLDAAAPGHRLLNEYTWGGFLIERRPGIPVFIDGRSEVYGDERLARYARLVKLEPGWQRTLDETTADLVLMPAEAPLVRSLLEGGWRELAADGVARLLARPDTAR
jgi:hypothetical protein